MDLLAKLDAVLHFMVGYINCDLSKMISINYFFLDFEKKSIQAAAAGQLATGCPVSFHPGKISKTFLNCAACEGASERLLINV